MIGYAKKKVRTGGRHFFVFRMVFPLFILLTIMIKAGQTGDASVTATLDKVSMSLEETAELVISVNGSGSMDLDIPEVAGLEFTPRGQNRQIQIINGTSSSSLSVIYSIQALRSGKFTIPAIAVQVDGKTLQTEAIPLEVVAHSQQLGSSSANQTDLPANPDGLSAFLRVEMPQQSYIGEKVPIHIKAYFSRRTQASVNTLPSLDSDGFAMEQLDARPTQTVEEIKGTTYNVLAWETSLTGIKEGTFPFQFQLDATLLVKKPGRSFSPFSNQDPFLDNFFDSLAGGYEKKPIRLTSPGEQVIDILPLPKENRPANFSGAIGDFTMQVKVEPTSVELGQPLAVTVTIEGTGNFDRVEPPVFPDQTGWKTYAPTAHFNPQGNSRQGKKIFEQAVIIRDKSVSQIPQLSFSYFDPQKKQYITRSSSPIPLAIKEGTQQPASSPVTTATTVPEPAKAESPGTAPETRNLLPLHSQIGHLGFSFTPLFARPWFIALGVFCGLILILLGVLRWRKGWCKDHPEQLRKKQLRQVLDKATIELDRVIASGDSTAFLSLCRSVIRQHLALLWQISPDSITLADLSTRLEPDSSLLEIYSAAEKGVYAGFFLSPETMRNYSISLKKECERLQ